MTDRPHRCDIAVDLGRTLGRWTVARRPLPDLRITDDRLVAADPLNGLPAPAFLQQVPSGAFPAWQTVFERATQSRAEPQFAVLRFAEAPVRRWAPARTRLAPTADEGAGYEAPSGLGCFCDYEAGQTLGRNRILAAVEQAAGETDAGAAGDRLVFFQLDPAGSPYRTWLGHGADDAVVVAVTDFGLDSPELFVRGGPFAAGEPMARRFGSLCRFARAVGRPEQRWVREVLGGAEGLQAAWRGCPHGSPMLEVAIHAHPAAAADLVADDARRAADRLDAFGVTDEAEALRALAGRLEAGEIAVWPAREQQIGLAFRGMRGALRTRPDGDENVVSLFGNRPAPPTRYQAALEADEAALAAAVRQRVPAVGLDEVVAMGEAWVARRTEG